MSASETGQTGRPRRTRSWLRWLGWGFLATLLVVAAIAAWAWTQRYSLIERQVITYLDSQGIDADLRIASATRTAADIRDIRLAYDGERFLAVEKLEAEYQWRDLLEGRVERLAFTGLDARVTVDERGRIIDGWRPPSTGQAAVFPPRGASVTRGTITVRSPFGVSTIKGDATAKGFDDFAFDGRVDVPDLDWNGLSGSVSGPVTIKRTPGTPIGLSASPLELSLTRGDMALRRTRLSLDGVLDTDDIRFDGDIGLESGSVSASGLDTSINALRFTGRLSRQSVVGDAQISFENARIVDADRRRSVARTLTLADALSDVPVARNFAPQLTPVMESLLDGSDVKGSIAVSRQPGNTTARLKQPLILKGGRTTLTLNPSRTEDTEEPFYRTDDAGYSLAFSGELDQPLRVGLRDTVITIASDNGVSVDGVRSATGRAVTRDTWRAQTPEGWPARLAPMSVAFDYRNPGDRPAALTLRGAADYDGDVPGGYVTGLAAQGRLDATLRENRPTANFTPSAPLAFTDLETTSEWSLHDFTGRIEPVSPLYARTGRDTARVQTRLRDAVFAARRRPDAVGGPATLDMSVGDATLTGTVREGGQDWDIAFEKFALKSPTFPVEGTDLALPSGTLELALSAVGRTQFKLGTPGSTLSTPLYAVRGMALSAEGTAEAYELAFSGGRVRVTGQPNATPLPVLPVTGTLRFEDGAFTGSGRTTLPRADDQPVEFDYRLRDGQGDATVRIRDLRFTPRGLQPQDLAPALRGKIAQVEGAIDADLAIRFGGDAPMSGSGTVDLKNLSLGTAPGPVSGLNGTVTLTSLFPVVTAPDQRLTLELFDPGFPLRDGEVVYELVEGGVAIRSAAWPLGEGRVTFDPFTWTYGAEENRVTLRVSGVEVGEFLKDVGNGALSATGTLQGAIPVVVRGIDVRVEGGRLDVPQGGVIRYTPKDGLGQSVANPSANMALKALENFRYQSLFAAIDGPLDGDVRLGMKFTGKNDEVLFGVPFAFDVSVEGELFNIARSFNTNATIKSQVGQSLSVVE